MYNAFINGLERGAIEVADMLGYILPAIVAGLAMSILVLLIIMFCVVLITKIIDRWTR